MVSVSPITPESDNTSYSPRETAAILGVADRTLRYWSSYFAQSLSASATAENTERGHRHRRYTPDDVAVLRSIQDLTRRNVPLPRIADVLAGRIDRTLVEATTPEHPDRTPDKRGPKPGNSRRLAEQEAAQQQIQRLESTVASLRDQLRMAQDRLRALEAAAERAAPVPPVQNVPATPAQPAAGRGDDRRSPIDRTPPLRTESTGGGYRDAARSSGRGDDRVAGGGRTDDGMSSERAGDRRTTGNESGRGRENREPVRSSQPPETDRQSTRGRDRTESTRPADRPAAGRDAVQGGRSVYEPAPPERERRGFARWFGGRQREESPAARRIIRAMATALMTRADLARRSGVPADVLDDILEYRQTADERTLAAIARALRINVADLIDE